MPKREVTSAPWVPVPARAYTGKAPRARQHRAVGRLSAGAPRLHKSCRWRRPQSKGRSCVSGRARWDLRVRGGRGHLSERPGWPSGAPISRGSTVSMIAFGGRRGPHRSGSRCRGRPIERREAGREGCLWPNAASQGRPPDGSGGETERALHSKRPREDLWWWWWWWQQLRITSGRLPRIWGSMSYLHLISKTSQAGAGSCLAPPRPACTRLLRWARHLSSSSTRLTAPLPWLLAYRSVRPGLTTPARVPRRLATACTPSARMVATGSRAPTASACRGRCTTPCATPWPGC